MTKLKKTKKPSIGAPEALVVYLADLEHLDEAFSELKQGRLELPLPPARHRAMVPTCCSEPEGPKIVVTSTCSLECCGAPRSALIEQRSASKGRTILAAGRRRIRKRRPPPRGSHGGG